jgi:(2R)-sulfolactate sulfo-lyase subunit alpha
VTATNDDSAPEFLVHHDDDHLGVAVCDLDPGTAQGVCVASGTKVTATVRAHVPFGHKLALADRRAGDDVIEYGTRIGIASADIAKGDYVHVHNLRSARWPQSTTS